MKKYLLALSAFIALTNTHCFYKEKYQEPFITGAWQYTDGNTVETMIIQQGYFSLASYDQRNKKLIHARGGKCAFDEKSVKYNVEFDTENRQAIRNSEEYLYKTESNGRMMRLAGKDWVRIDGGYGSEPVLGGIWKATNYSKLFSEQSSGKLLQILSGKRFQRFLIDPDKAACYNTEGGTYSFNDGIYTETIEFTSGDNSEVGHIHTYESKVENNTWRYRSIPPTMEVSAEWVRQFQSKK